jgi:serine/threonine protein kinase
VIPSDLLLALELDPDEGARLWLEWGGDGDPYRFVAWLHEQGHIDRRRFLEIEGLGELRLDELSMDSLVPLEDSDRLLERYNVLGPVGRGAMGEVFVVREEDLGRRVALKRLRAEALGERVIQARFYREAQITAQLEHPAIVPVYRLERAGIEIAYTMKLVEGRTLKEYMREARDQLREGRPTGERFAQGTRLRHLLRVCEALHYAHTRGFLHRDIKPSNIMLGSFGEVYLMDWGIARRIEGEADDLEALSRLAFDEDVALEATRLGVALGTPGYMAPEQALGDPSLGVRAEVYSLGVVLQELCTLQAARPGQTSEELLAAARVGGLSPIQPMQGLEPLEPELRAIIETATQREPSRRYGTVQELREDLERYLDGRSVSVLEDSLLRRVERWMVRRATLAVALLAGLLLVVLGTASLSLLRETELLRADRQAERSQSDLLQLASEHARGIDASLQDVEIQVHRLEGAASQALMSGGGAGSEPTYLLEDFRDPEAAPRGLAPQEGYASMVDLGMPVFVSAPGLSPTRALELAAQLAPLRHAQREALDSHAALDWAYLGMEEGLMMGLPGTADYPDGFDPRERPWYRQAMATDGLVWGTPYQDALGQGWLVPCSSAVRSPSGRLLGVVGVDLSLAELTERLLDSSGLGEVRSAWILDERAQVVATSADWRITEAGMPPFADAAVVSAIRSGAGKGAYYQEVAGADEVTLVLELERLGWYYAVVADAARVRAR